MSVQADWFDNVAVDAPTRGSDPFANYSGEEVSTSVSTTDPPLVRADERPHTRDEGQDENGNGSYPLADRFTPATSIEELEDRLRELLKREGNCFEAGIECALKERPDMVCSACPFHEVGQDTRKSALCRLGKEQERIAALLAGKRHGGVT